jgi:leucine dehydrogenase
VSIFEHREFAGHERVLFCSDEPAGLRAIIAIHDRTLGPAVGGCRLFPYRNEDAALTDVLRVSKGMTYQNALAGLPFGGGKSVILADPSAKTPALLRAYAEFVERLHGEYWTGEGVNIGTADVEVLARHTRYVMGRVTNEVHSGDPSPFTAAGCIAGMKACLQHVFGTTALAGRRVAIQGVGNVGFALARLVADAGATLVVSDVRRDLSERARLAFGAVVVSADEIYDQACDIFAPCAMGGVLTDETVRRLHARIVCGAANNQLATPGVGQLLAERGIAYAPDYVVNAGGLLNASGDFFGRYDADDVWRRVRAIQETTARVLATAARERRPTHEVADRMAQAIVDAGRRRANGPV